MKSLGAILIILGLICGYNALTMDVSVAAGPFGRIANTDLMSQRQNFLIVSGVLFIAGILLVGFGVASSSRENSQTTQDVTGSAGNPKAHPADVNCTKCGVTLRLDSHELQTGQYSCPSCNTTSKLGAASIAAAMPAQSEPENRECPMCAEIIKYRAKICRFCNHPVASEDPVAA